MQFRQQVLFSSYWW